MIFYNDFEGLDFFEACYQRIIIEDGNLIVPYINIGVCEHPLNTGNNLQYINFSYVICEKVAHIKLNGKLIYEEESPKIGEYIFRYLGGIDLTKKEGMELEVLCKKAILLTIPETKLSDQFWVPFDRGNLKKNMEPKQVKEFYEKTPDLSLLG